ARARDRLAVNTAETRGQRGEIALARLRYTEAAKHFADAAVVFPPESTQAAKKNEYLDREADAFFRQGNEFGDNSALLQVIDRLKALLRLRPRERVPLDWAMTQNNLANALRTLGERESGTARLEEAVTAYRDTLKEWTRERVPLQWASGQNNLGDALRML